MNRRQRRREKSKKRGSFKGQNLSGKNKSTNADYLHWFNN